MSFKKWSSAQSDAAKEKSNDKPQVAPATDRKAADPDMKEIKIGPPRK